MEGGLDFEAFEEQDLAAQQPQATGAISRTILLPIQGIPNLPTLVLLARNVTPREQVLVQEEVFMPAMVAHRILQHNGLVTTGAMEKACRAAGDVATPLELGELKRALALKTNIAKAVLYRFVDAAAFLLAHARDRDAMARVVGSFREIQPLSRSPLYAIERLNLIRPPIVVSTPEHARRRLIPEGQEDANSMFAGDVEDIATLFDKSLLDPRKFTQLAELRSKYNLLPTVFMTRKTRLVEMLTSALSALVGYHAVVYNAPAPESFAALFGPDAITILEYLVLQLNFSAEPAPFPSILCGPTTLTADMVAFSLVYQWTALRAVAEDNLVVCDRCMRIAASLLNLSKGIDRIVPVKLRHVVDVDRFRDPIAVVSKVEGYIKETAKLATPLASTAEAVRIRDAAMMGLLGAVAGGHRVSQSIASLHRSSAEGCAECSEPGCPGNRVALDLGLGTLTLRLVHHKNQRAQRGVAVRPLHVTLKHPDLVRVLSVYETDARRMLHGATASPYLFLTHEGSEIGRGDRVRWHQRIGEARASANHLVLEMTQRVLGIKPGMTARDLRRMWVSVVHGSKDLDASTRTTLFGLIGTTDRQVRRTYDVVMTSRALEELATKVQSLAVPSEPGDAIHDLHAATVMPPRPHEPAAAEPVAPMASSESDSEEIEPQTTRAAEGALLETPNKDIRLPRICTGGLGGLFRLTEERRHLERQDEVRRIIGEKRRREEPSSNSD